jgi:hypothetical protein
MLSAWRGTGKTLWGLSLAVAVASGGSFLGWQATRPRRGLYIDGEMCVEDVKEYLSTIAPAIGQDWDEDFLRIVTPDQQIDSFATIQTREGQEQIEDLLKDTDLLILDNLISLADSRAESDPEVFDSIKTWQFKLRREGVASILMHHVGKRDGGQRGHSGKEDALSWSIELTHPGDYCADQGARFNLRFTKMRANVAVPPFEAWLRDDQWVTRPLEDVVVGRVIELARDHSYREIAKILEEEGIRRSKSTVERILKLARAEGKLS